MGRTVSGLTKTSASCQRANSGESATRMRRSRALNRARLSLRAATMSCWRSIAFSARPISR
jgi:hypothetical protein